MITREHTGTEVYRVTGHGTVPVFLNRVGLSDDNASVSSRGRHGGWAIDPMFVRTRDLFPTHAEALAEFRARRRGQKEMEF
jgi:hypothetical protein